MSELVSLYAGDGAEVQSLTRDGDVVTGLASTELGASVVRVITQLDRGQSAVWELRYRVPMEGRSYRLRVIPQPLAKDATLSVSVSAAPGVALESRDTVRWARGGAAFEGPLDAEREVHVRLVPPHSGLGDRIRDFWTSPAGS